MLQRTETSDSHRMSPTRPEINAKSFVFWHVFRSSRRCSPIWVMSLHVEAPFVKNFQFLIFGFFPMIWKIDSAHASDQEFCSKSGFIPRNYFFSPVVHYGGPFPYAQPHSQPCESGSCAKLSSARKLYVAETQISSVAVNYVSPRISSRVR